MPESRIFISKRYIPRDMLCAMRCLFLSDVHLHPDTPKSLEQLAQWLDFCKKNIQSLYILGDLFEAWLGDDDPNEYYQKVISLLRACSEAGTNIYVMCGNRDFLLGKRFTNAIGGILLADPSFIELQGQKTLLTHGDQLCTDDVPYQRYRRVIQHPVVRWLLNHLPLRYRQSLAKKLRQQSRQYQSTTSAQIMDVNHQELERWFDKYQCQQIIHGHTHRPSIHWLRHQQLWRKHYVLSDWDREGNALLFIDNEPPLLLKAPPTQS
jgi:UDP-2,3-diacylglucosamine hydrolase